MKIVHQQFLEFNCVNWQDIAWYNENISLNLFEISFVKESVNFVETVIGQNKSGITREAKSK